MWVGLFQSVEGLQSKDWGFSKKKFFLRPQHRNPTWVCSQLDHPTYFRLGSSYNHVNQSLKSINKETNKHIKGGI